MKKQLVMVLRVILIAAILPIAASCGNNNSAGDTYADGLEMEISYGSDPLNELDGPEVWIDTAASTQCSTYCKSTTEAQSELEAAGVTVLEIHHGSLLMSKVGLFAAFCGGPTYDIIVARIPQADYPLRPDWWGAIDPADFGLASDCAWNLPCDIFCELP